MTTDSINEGDPFADSQVFADDEGHFVANSTLSIGRNASLTLGTDALIILDEGPREEPYITCCGLFPSRSTITHSIPFFNVLWAALTKVDLTIHYAKSTSSTSLRVAYLTYPLDLSSTASSNFASSWTDRLLDRAYGPAQRRKRVKVYCNPYGGAGRAVKLYTSQVEPILAAARCQIDVERTAYSGHAVELAENLDINAFDVVAAASGDGVVYEIFNGLAKKTNAAEALRKIAVAQLPCGTGNAMSWNLNGTDDCSVSALCIVKGIRTPLDLSSVTQGDRRTISFLSQSVGIVAEADLGTDNIRWMGDARFQYGVLVRLLGKTLYPCDIAVKVEIENKEDIKRHYAAEVTRNKSGRETQDVSLIDMTTTDVSLPTLKHGTVLDALPSPSPSSGWTSLAHYSNLGNFYSGNMAIMTKDAPFFPSSVPSDGMMDLVTIDGDIGRMTAVDLLLAVPKGTFFDKECVRIRKVSAFRVVPRFGKWANTGPAAGESNGSVAGKGQKSRLGRALQTLGISGGDQGNRDGGYISIDGEKYPFAPFQVEVHRGLGTVLSRSGRLYESPGPSGWEAFVQGQEMTGPNRTGES